jgi:hypothetical protein
MIEIELWQILLIETVSFLVGFFAGWMSDKTK